MVDRTQGRKISKFIQQDTVLANSYLDYVVNGTNYKISYTDFVSNLGVTGSLAQEGAATGAPVLDVNGTVNNIRNIEDGAGIAANISPENGIKLSHTFVSDADGQPILINSASLTPIIASIVAGSGISVALVNSGGIQISSVADQIYGQLTIHNNAVETSIVTAGVPVLVAGTWVPGISGSFTLSAGGRMTYVGPSTEVVSVVASITMTPASGVSKELTVYLSKNNSPISAAKISRIVSSSESANVSISYNLSLTTNDYIELFVANETDTINVLVTDALFGVS
jgi:hypothetical protein